MAKNRTTAPEGLKEINTDGLVADKATPWAFNLSPTLTGTLLSTERKLIKGFEQGQPARNKCVARVEVQNEATGEPEVYAAFLPEAYLRLLARMNGRTISIVREGEGFDTRYRLFA